MANLDRLSIVDYATLKRLTELGGGKPPTHFSSAIEVDPRRIGNDQIQQLAALASMAGLTVRAVSSVPSASSSVVASTSSAMPPHQATSAPTEENRGNESGVGVTLSEARIINDGPYVFGPEEMSELHNFEPSYREMQFFNQVPFSVETLRRCATTHLLIAHFTAGSVEDQLKEFRSSDRYGTAVKFFVPSWHFLKGTYGSSGWHLVRFRNRDIGADKNWTETERLMPPRTRPITAAVLFDVIYAMWQLRSVLLWNNRHVRVADNFRDRHAIVIGKQMSSGEYSYTLSETIDTRFAPYLVTALEEQPVDRHGSFNLMGC